MSSLGQSIGQSASLKISRDGYAVGKDIRFNDVAEATVGLDLYLMFSNILFTQGLTIDQLIFQRAAATGTVLIGIYDFAGNLVVSAVDTTTSIGPVYIDIAATTLAANNIYRVCMHLTDIDIVHESPFRPVAAEDVKWTPRNDLGHLLPGITDLVKSNYYLTAQQTISALPATIDLTTLAVSAQTTNLLHFSMRVSEIS